MPVDRAPSAHGSATTQISRRSTGRSGSSRDIGARQDRSVHRGVSGNILNTLSAKELRTMSSDQIDLLWRQIDNDGNGRLSRQELAKLCIAIVARVSEILHETIRAQMPDASEATIEKAVAQERAFLLPRGYCKTSHGNDIDAEKMTAADWEKQMHVYLSNVLDINSDGTITKFEFSDTWGNVAEKVFKLDDTSHPSGCASQ